MHYVEQRSKLSKKWMSRLYGEVFDTLSEASEQKIIGG